MNQNGSGGAGGERSRVQNTYSYQLYLRNRLIFFGSALVSAGFVIVPLTIAR